MLRIDTAFMLVASACLIVGVSMGIAMGVAHDFQFAPVHAHLNLLGWASLALFGLTYKAYPMLANSRLALIHLALSSVSALLFPAGIYFSIAHGAPGLAIGASLVWFLGALLFFANLVRSFVFAPTVRGPEPRRALA
jgi:hypothetical protein